MDTVSIICIALIPVFIMGVYILYLNREGKNIKEELKLLPRRIIYGLLKLIIWGTYLVTILVCIELFKSYRCDPDREWWWIPTLIICGCAIELAAKLLSHVVDKYIKVRKANSTNQD